MNESVKEIVKLIEDKKLSRSDYNLLLDSIIEKEPEFNDLLEDLITRFYNNVVKPDNESDDKSISNLRPQGKIMRVLKIFALMQYEVLDKGIEELKKQMLVQTAEDEWLDLHAQRYSIERKILTNAVGKVYVGATTKPKITYTFKKGNIVAAKSTINNEPLKFKTLNDVEINEETKPYEDNTIDDDDKKVYRVEVPVIALKGGDKYNGAMITEISTAVQHFDYVRNKSIIGGGIDKESDDDFRQRIIHSASGSVEGSIGWFKAKAESQELVKEAKIVPRMHGEGSVGIIVRGYKDSSNASINPKDIENKINAKEHKPLANWRAFVSLAEVQPIKIELTIYYRKTKPLEKDIKDALDQYFNKFNPGDVFVKEKMESFIINAPNVFNIKTGSIKIPNNDSDTGQPWKDIDINKGIIDPKPNIIIDYYKDKGWPKLKFEDFNEVPR